MQKPSTVVEPILPVELGAGKVRFAQGMKAGRWVFATGVTAQEFATGIAPDVARQTGNFRREKQRIGGPLAACDGPAATREVVAVRFPPGGCND